MKSYFDISMHDILTMKIGHCFADISEITLYVPFSYWLHFDFLEKGSPIRVLKYHIGDFSLGIDVNIYQLDDLWMG
jgi:hypothetical protein